MPAPYSNPTGFVVPELLYWAKTMNRKIEVNPKIMCGKPIIKGTRIPVYLILNLLAAGYTFERIIKAYPELTKRDIKAALDYAQALTKFEEKIIPKISYEKVPA